MTLNGPQLLFVGIAVTFAAICLNRDVAAAMMVVLFVNAVHVGTKGLKE